MKNELFSISNSPVFPLLFVHKVLRKLYQNTLCVFILLFHIKKVKKEEHEKSSANFGFKGFFVILVKDALFFYPD